MADTYLCATKYITHDVNETYKSIIQSQGNAWNTCMAPDSVTVTHLTKLTPKYMNINIHVIIEELLRASMCNICICYNINNR